MNIKYLFFTLMSVLLLIPMSGCKDKHITYVQMVDREKKEINAFMSKQGFKVMNSYSESEVTKDKVFCRLIDGVYMHVINHGTPKPTDGTRMTARFKVTSFVPSRLAFEVDNISPDRAAGEYPLCFIFSENRDRLIEDPSALDDERANFPILCPAILEALKYVGDGGVIQLVTSFKEGPSFTSSEGVPLYFEKLEFRFNKN